MSWHYNSESVALKAIYLQSNACSWSSGLTSTWLLGGVGKSIKHPHNFFHNQSKNTWKRELLIAVLLIPLSAQAKTPEDVGRLFADVVACHVAGEFNKAEKASIDLKIIDRYNIVKKDRRWKKRMEKGRNREFRRLDNLGPIEKAIMCGVIENRWLD